MITRARSLPKFWLRCGFGILALLMLTTGAGADDAAKLDPKGRQIYEALLDSSPPIEIQNDGTGFGLKLLRVSGHPRYDKPPANGSIAEVIYDFKAPAGTDKFSIYFWIYPDSKSAAEAIGGRADPISSMQGLPVGSFGVNFSSAANEAFEKKQMGAIFINNETAFVRYAYQIDRIIITSKTDANFPGVAIHGSDALLKFLTNEAKTMVKYAWLLLSDGKDVLDQPEIKALLK